MKSTVGDGIAQIGEKDCGVFSTVAFPLRADGALRHRVQEIVNAKLTKIRLRAGSGLPVAGLLGCRGGAVQPAQARSRLPRTDRRHARSISTGLAAPAAGAAWRAKLHFDPAR